MKTADGQQGVRVGGIRMGEGVYESGVEMGAGFIYICIIESTPYIHHIVYI